MRGDSLFALLMRMPALRTIEQPSPLVYGGFPSLGDQIRLKFTVEQRVALHRHLPHLHESLLLPLEWCSLPRPLDPSFCPELRSISDPSYSLPNDVIAWLDARCSHLDKVMFVDSSPSSQPHLMNLVSRCNSLAISFAVRNVDDNLRLLLGNVHALTSFSCDCNFCSFEVLSCLRMDTLSRSLASLDIVCDISNFIDLLLSVGWPRLLAFHCYIFESPAAGKLEQLVSRMPALTDLQIKIVGHKRPDSCCFSSASVARLASQLRVLEVDSLDPRYLDLLPQLSFTPSSCRCLESLSVFLPSGMDEAFLTRLQQMCLMERILHR